MLELLRDYLEKLKFKVSEATDGIQELEKMEEES